MIRKKCLVCDSENLSEIINLGSHPFADTFVPKSKLGEGDMTYPLVCDLCKDCGQVQTKYETDPKQRYSQIEYSYTSSNSSFSMKHWDEYAQEVLEEIKSEKNVLVVEIGSNDGYLAEHFLKKGINVVGIDPSPYMAELAKQRNVNTIVELFGRECSKQILSKYGKANLVIANNVFNHADNPVEFVRCVSEILKEEGSFVFEQPYWLIGVKSGKFDQIYHEHVSYFTIRSLSALLSRANMDIKSVKVVDYHGGSLRVVAQHKNFLKEKSDDEKSMLLEEEKYGLFNIDTYEKFMQKNFDRRNKLLKQTHDIKKEGDAIIAVGAAAKGNTFLNFYKLDNTVVDYVTDSSPHKKGKYTPLSRIPIVGDEIFANYKNKKVYALILSWNIAEQIKSILFNINPNIEFISPEESV